MPEDKTHKTPDATADQSSRRSSRCKQSQTISFQHGYPFNSLLNICTIISDLKQPGQLLDTIAIQIRSLIASDGGAILLLDKLKNELVTAAVSFENAELAAQFEARRRPIGQGMAGRVYETGNPLIANSYENGQNASIPGRIVNRLDVPLKKSGRTVGVLSAINKNDGDFHQEDISLLCAVAGLTALAMDNIHMRESLADYRRQLNDFNRAKDHVIHQLSHAIKTPLAVLIASLKLLRKYLNKSPDSAWLPVHDRAQRNLSRLLTIEYEMEDILRQRQDSADAMTSPLVEPGDPAMVASQKGHSPSNPPGQKR